MIYQPGVLFSTLRDLKTGISSELAHCQISETAPEGFFFVFVWVSYAEFQGLYIQIMFSCLVFSIMRISCLHYDSYSPSTLEHQLSTRSLNLHIVLSNECVALEKLHTIVCHDGQQMRGDLSDFTPLQQEKPSFGCI